MDVIQHELVTTVAGLDNMAILGRRRRELDVTDDATSVIRATGDTPRRLADRFGDTVQTQLFRLFRRQPHRHHHPIKHEQVKR